MKAPDETRRAVGKRVDGVEQGHELGRQRCIDRRLCQRDVDLRELKVSRVDPRILIDSDSNCPVVDGDAVTPVEVVQTSHGSSA
jgi:hypothetical protein